MKNNKKIPWFYIFLAMCLTFSVIVLIVYSFQPSSQRPLPHIYIALGDSVSSGYGLRGYIDSPEGRHSTLFFEKLYYLGYADEYINMAVSDFTTSMLLDLLESLDDECLRRFESASVITLNIGGNNILTPFLEYLVDLQVVTGVGNIRTGTGGVLSGGWAVIYEIINGVGGALSISDSTSFRVGGIVTGFGNIISGIGELFVGTGEIIAGSPDVIATWRGSLSPELEYMLNTGVYTFAEEFTQIISWLHLNAPDATIIVNTVHNPIPTDILLISVPMSNWASVLIESMNHIIVEKSLSNDFLVADTFSVLSNQMDLMIFNLNPFYGSISFDIVHPNEKGHELIAQLHYDVFISRHR